jgi:4-carboxymuconolactone decarboxylase
MAKTPVEYLRGIHAPSAEAFQALRKAVVASGPLDGRTVELIVLAGLVTAGSERSFRTHATRLLKDGVDPAAIRQAVLVTLGASASFNQVVTSLEWVDDLVSAAGGAA